MQLQAQRRDRRNLHRWSSGLARGYSKPGGALTKEKFIENPFKEGERLYTRQAI